MPAALVVWAVVAIAARSAESLGWMVQLMFFLVGWHYVKQGFGVLTVLSARRGVRIMPRERAVILLHCFAGWAYAWASPASPAPNPTLVAASPGCGQSPRPQTLRQSLITSAIARAARSRPSRRTRSTWPGSRSNSARAERAAEWGRRKKTCS